ncbi:MAG: glycosyltransferase family 4 protein [Gemmatimonadetes bacterium]|uniref:Glycosyltransferase family 4 protein n=1 Tax=Candidatus Kutchimonas denitrificans TaxID=3056748 RepID=A0AAE4Z989_9BACT|nr:glycosyltransferase family 4 protein [Gemmatimonadota bacterium]NIR73826.1 glycosyltransferase family 4 protein [Candidatus Kutchimonas denitrificans]NIS00099.1 glycosyltransferase family 4 protein [Gemmatimonadota bacterium]NIT65688.1 glycosyltransferase family 4 protein [Gemmatimonadota bacterium]NIU53136.1 glycosyltransferase [Gemmatimonadota bacterium]
MKIAVLTEYYPDERAPASGVYVHQRVRGYRAAGHEPRVFRVREGDTESAAYDHVKVTSGRASELGESLADFAPDVLAVHTPHPDAGHTRLAATVPIPRAVWIHGYEAMMTAVHGYHRGVFKLLSLFHDVRKLRRLRRFLTDSAAVVYVSDWLRRTAERGTRYRHPSTEIIPNGVDTDVFRPRAAPASGGARLRGIALRNLGPKYGLDLAVTAYGGVVESELTIVGTGPEANRLRHLIARNAAPVTLEARAVPHSEVPALLNDFDYFVAPARTEAQGVAMCEAMACGLPVVATRVGGIPEFVRDGIDGLLTRPGSASDLRRAVRQLVGDRDRAREMGVNARKYIQARCASAVVIPRELELLAGVAR